MDAATLRSVPLFSSLDSKATAELGKYLTIHDYPKSATIFRNGVRGEPMNLIDFGKGRITITDPNAPLVKLARLGREVFLGYMAIPDIHRHPPTTTPPDD